MHERLLKPYRCSYQFDNDVHCTMEGVTDAEIREWLSKEPFNLNQVTDVKLKRFKEALNNPTHHNEHESDGASNDCLEFLGDAVLEFSVCRRLFFDPNWTTPYANPGSIGYAKKNDYVCNLTLYKISEAIHVLDYLLISPDNLKELKHDKAIKYLSDTVEALIAAVYLEYGLETACSVVDHMLGGKLISLDLDAFPWIDPEDARLSTIKNKIQRFTDLNALEKEMKSSDEGCWNYFCDALTFPQYRGILNIRSNEGLAFFGAAVYKLYTSSYYYMRKTDAGTSGSLTDLRNCSTQEVSVARIYEPLLMNKDVYVFHGRSVSDEDCLRIERAVAAVYAFTAAYYLSAGECVSSYVERTLQMNHDVIMERMAALDEAKRLNYERQTQRVHRMPYILNQEYTGSWMT